MYGLDLLTLCHCVPSVNFLGKYSWPSGGSRIFPGGGGAKPQGGAPGYDFIKFSRKLHEIEKNLVATGGGARRGRPPRSATVAPSSRAGSATDSIQHLRCHFKFKAPCEFVDILNKIKKGQVLYLFYCDMVKSDRTSKTKPSFEERFY